MKFDFQYHGGSWFVGVLSCGAFFGHWSWWALLLAPVFLIRIWSEKERLRVLMEKKP